MRSLIFGLLILLFFPAWSEWQISGYVRNEQGEPLNQVLVKSRAGYALSGSEGDYRIKVADGDSLLFHKIGYEDVIIDAELLPTVLEIKRLVLPISGKNIYESAAGCSSQVRKITLTENEKLQYISAADYLASESNLIMSGIRLAGSHQTLNVPGYDARHTLVMLDGIAMNRSGEEFDLSRIPLSMISEMEIMPGSVEAGSGSMGTVLNLITGTKDRAAELSSSLSYGSYDNYAADICYSKALEKFRLQGNISYQQGENDFSYPVPEDWQVAGNTQVRKNNNFRQLDLAAFGRYNSEWGDWNVKLYYTDFFRMLPGAINTPLLFEGAAMTGEIWKVHAGWNLITRVLNYQINTWYHSEQTIYDNTHLDEPHCYNLYYYKYGINNKGAKGIKPQITWKQFDNIDIILGVELSSESYEYEETTRPANSIARKLRQSQACFTENTFTTGRGVIKPWLKLSGRYDKAEAFEGHASGSVFAGVEKEGLVRLKGSIGRLRGFTLPSFYSMYWRGDAEGVGNPDLQAETSKGWQAAAGIRYQENSFDITGRSDVLENMIIWLQTFNSSWKPTNIGAAEVKNLQFRCELHPLKNLILKAVYNRTITADKTVLANGEPSAYYEKELIYTPDYQGNISLQWRVDKIKFEPAVELTGSQWTTRDQLMKEKQLAAYKLYNCSLGYFWEIGTILIELELQVNNILDGNYNTYEYIPQPGRNYNLNFNIRW
jgi:outer membrane cobalamin receptor